MTQHANLPAWLKWTGRLSATPMLVAAREWLASVVMLGFRMFKGRAKTKSPNGTSRFAKRSETTKAGLTRVEVVIFGECQDGAKKSAFLTVLGKHHVCLSAPTRSGMYVANEAKSHASGSYRNFL
jgi:hypothetical protein